MNKIFAWVTGILTILGAAFVGGMKRQRDKMTAKINKANAEQATKTQRATDEARRKANAEIDKARNAGDDYFNNDRM